MTPAAMDPLLEHVRLWGACLLQISGAAEGTVFPLPSNGLIQTGRSDGAQIRIGFPLPVRPGA